MRARGFRHRRLALAVAAWSALRIAGAAPDARPAFDADYADYARLLTAHVKGSRVDYAALKGNRAALDAVVRAFADVSAAEEAGWPRAARIAFWINAYNAFTLQAIVDHYPIQGSWLSLLPRNSIRQIDGVWTRLRWRAAGRDTTLDEIEHQTLRKVLVEPRIHFAVNCASKSCPPLRHEPYRAAVLDAQLDDAARRYLAGPYGLQVSGTTLRVSSIFKWYGEDFVAGYRDAGPPQGDAQTRAILGVVARYGPADAARLARSGEARLVFLPYDWSLNDIERGSGARRLPAR
jgi:hypothetical protein